MGNFKIHKVSAYNFKGFPKLNLDLSDNDYTILGGKNGYGKTTIFHAIELVLKGSIDHMVALNTLTDRRGNLNDNKKPLVYDTEIPVVSIELLIEINNSKFWLKREAKTTDLKNPVTFAPFQQVYIKRVNSKDQEEGDYNEITNDDLRVLLSDSITSKYGFLYYLDQEEADHFLKSPSKTRRADINSLFDMEAFDNDIEKIEYCHNKLAELKTSYSNELDTYERTKKEIESSLDINGHQEAHYVRLASGREWDSENPNLDIKILNALVGPNGLLTEAAYYITYREDYKKFSLKEYTKRYQTEQVVNDLSIYIQFAAETDLLNLYDAYLDGNAKIYHGDNLDAARSSFRNIHTILGKFLPDETIRSIDEKLGQISSQQRQMDNIQQSYLKLWTQREGIERLFASPAFNDYTNCPLCGHEYENREVLMNHIREQGDFLKRLVDSMVANQRKLLEGFKDFFKKMVIAPLEKILSENGITPQVRDVTRNSNLHQFLESLKNIYGVVISKGATIDATHNIVRSVFSKIQRYEEKDINYQRLQSFHLSRLNDFNQDTFTLKNIKLKTDYILTIWTTQSNEILKKLNKEIAHLKDILKDIQEKQKNVQNVLSSLKDQKEAYILKLIEDIEILLYIYSGRIMQTCHYGRGVFLKYNKKTNVLFTAGDITHDVDALINMSSGQISAVVISFMLALNKLYADHKFIAIDDPVQTMDDMNIWGLIETLRHEFRDYSVIMSTHEQSFGSLMRYKLAKMGINVRYMDTNEMRKLSEEG